MTDTNSTGIAPDSKKKAPSALSKLVESLKGQKKPNASDIKAIGEKFKKFGTEREKLVKALQKLDADADSLAIDMVKCHGTTHVTVEGVRYVPTSRGDRVYYKRMSDEHETVEL